MIRHKSSRRNEQEMRREEKEFNVTFYRMAQRKEFPQKMERKQKGGEMKGHASTYRGQETERRKCYTEPVEWNPVELQSIVKSQEFKKRKEPRFLPTIDFKSSKAIHSCKLNDQFSAQTDQWIDKLKAKLQVKRIYAEQGRIVAQNIQCWKRIKARANILKQIKRQKLRLLAQYAKQ